MSEQQQTYEQDGQEVKKKKPIKLYIILGAIVGFIILLIVANVSTKRKEEKLAEESRLAAEAEAAASQAEMEDSGEGVQLSDAEIEQQALVERYGEPPQGFRWDDEGNPVPVSDETLTAEEVVYHYLRSLSTLDMSNAAKYVSNSAVITTYNGYYDADSSENYYTQFLRKLLSQSLLSIEILGTEREAMFANGKRIYTMNIRIADLSYKDFFKENEDEIFSQIRLYKQTESDDTKAQQYICNKILEYFSSDNYKKRDVQIDVVLDKVTFGGWLVTDDVDLNMCCNYTDGTSVYSYMMECYADWVDRKLYVEELN